MSIQGMDKDVVQIYNGILLSHKKEWNCAICRDMDGPRDCHREWSFIIRQWKTDYVMNIFLLLLSNFLLVLQTLKTLLSWA